MDEGESLMGDESAMSLGEFLSRVLEMKTADMQRWEAHEYEQSLMLEAASAVEAGAERSPEMPDDTLVFKTVKLKTGLFEGTAIPLYQMPGLKVLEVMLLPHEPVKMAKMVELLTSALGSDKEVEMLGLVSMHELNELLSQWVDKSQEAENKDE